ncbi:MAG: hypothetical protein KBD01_18170 [Acidobacteria bacterium]|nr:hypothetical protein [Acidobacteriota bacterium]
MAFAAWKDIIIAHGRSGPIYRLYSAIGLLSGDMSGTWTIVDRSTSDPWTSDTSPVSGSWLVVQSESARTGGEKMQVFLGCSTEYRQALAGFGNKDPGVYCAVSPDGGWDETNHYFGASLANWRNTILAWPTSYTTAATLNLVLTSGTTNRPGTIALVVRSGSGHNYGLLAGGLVPLAPITDSVGRLVYLNGTARFDTSIANAWAEAAGARGRVPTAALDAYDLAYASFTPPARDRETGDYTEADVPVHDYSAGRSVGVIDEIRVTTMPNGDMNVAGDRHAWDGVSYPREAARDGSWV